MAAKDYKLCPSPLTGAVYISKVSKRDNNVMLDDRRVLDKAEFYNAIIQHVLCEIKETDTVMGITINGDTVMNIQIDRKMMKKHKII